jgi:hypothetical protein
MSRIPGVSFWTQPAESPLQGAFQHRLSGLQVEGEGVVTKILADDLEGSWHQRFILELPHGQTVLVAHNGLIISCRGPTSSGDQGRRSSQTVASLKIVVFGPVAKKSKNSFCRQSCPAGDVLAGCSIRDTGFGDVR